MPLVDMPLEKLRKYQGRNPKPADFEAFWEMALAEIGGLMRGWKRLGMRLARGLRNVFICISRARMGAVYAKLLRPRGITKIAPAVVMFYGYAGHSGEWSDNEHVAQGYVVASLDNVLRGEPEKYF